MLDVIDNGHKILFENAPNSYCFENRGSTIKYNDFVSESIWELLERGCIKEFSYLPEFITFACSCPVIRQVAFNFFIFLTLTLWLSKSR